MSNKRIITIINIVLTILVIVGTFVPLVKNGSSLYAHTGNVAKYIIWATSLLPLITNGINKKVEYGFIYSGYVFFYMLAFGWGDYDIVSYGYYMMLVSSLALTVLTIVYGFVKDETNNNGNKQNVHSQFKSNDRVMNGYPNGRGGNMQMPYPNQMMYRNNNQMYNNNGYNRR